MLYLVLGLGGVLVSYLLLTNSTHFGLGGGAVLVLFFLMQALPGFIERKVKLKEKE